MQGDLITASFMNRMLDQLESLETRITALEGAGGPQNAVVITDLQPSHSMRIGEILTVVGRNFLSPPENNEVTIAGVRVSANLFKFNSDETHLVFDIPPVPNIETLPQPVTVQVRNRHGVATASLTLQPALRPPTGRVEVAYVVAPVMPVTAPNIAAGASYIFTFSITAFVDLEATYQLAPSMPGWNPQLLQDNSDQPRTNNLLTIPAGVNGVSRNIRVQVTAPAGQPDGTTGTLRLDVLETSGFGRVTPGNALTDITIGAPPPTPEDRVRVSIRSVTPPPAQLVGNRAQFRRAASGAISFNLAFTSRGDYEATAEFRNAQGWTPTSPQVSPQNISVSTDPPPGTPANQPVQVIVTPGTGATDTDLILTIRSVSGATPPVHVRYAQGLSVVES
jgi:hypothetical protein